MKGEWLRRPQGETSVVFVHGILSSGEACWRHKNGTYWPELLKDEKDLETLGIYVFTYRTDIFSGRYQLGDAVDSLKEHMNLDKLFDSKRIIFVCHSMGGIIVRQFLVSQAVDLILMDIEIGLFLVASPSLGSSYANLLLAFAKILNNSQAQALQSAQNNTWLNDLDKNFRNLKEAGKLKISGKELIEDNFIVFKKIIGKQVVEPFSAGRYFGETYKVPHSDHSSISKPENKGAIQHRQLCKFIKDMLIAESVTAEQKEVHINKSKEEESKKIRLQPGNRFFVRIKKKGGLYYSKISDKSGTIFIKNAQLELNPNAQIEDGISLRDVVEKFNSGIGNLSELKNFFTDARQLKIGNYLYDQLFSRWLDRPQGQGLFAEICIITKDEYLLQIPWTLMADKGIFLTSSRWKIFQSPFLPKGLITLNPYPKILIILPQPQNYSITDGDTHLENLKALLQTVAPDLASDSCLKVVYTWDELQQIFDFKPQIIYYYGHGEYRSGVSRLIFEKRETNEADSKAVKDFSKLLRKLETAPQIVYLNTCPGETTRWLGVVNQLAEIVPVVIANRITTHNNFSRQIAINFFYNLLKNNTTPVDAINEATSMLSQEMNRCFTPVCYATYQDYQEWKSIPGKAEKWTSRNPTPNWLITVDRNEQCRHLVYETMKMIKNKTPRSLGFFWYGESGEGVDIFHKRFRNELRNYVHDVVLLDKTIEWPTIVDEISASLEELYRDSFKVENLEDIRIAISQLHPYISGKTRIVLIDHLPFEVGKTKRINSNVLEEYLSWWSTRLIHCFPHELYVLLGMSFIVPTELLEEFSKDTKEILDSAATDHFATSFLPCLKKLEASDLIEFFRTHPTVIPPDKLREVIKNVLKKSDGRYEETLNLLKDVEKNWFQYIDRSGKEIKRTW